MTKVQQRIEVEAPIRVVYSQWTQFEEFPQFMDGVQQVEQLDDRTLRWVAEVAGVRRQWNATVLEQVPDRKVAWAATEGATNAGAVSFVEAGPERTTVILELDYEPEGLVEKAGDALGLVERQAKGDLDRFKEFIEHRGSATGEWRGRITDQPDVGTPDVEDAAASRGDGGKAGVTAKAATAAIAAASGLAAAAAVGVAAAVRPSDSTSQAAPTDPMARDVVDVLTEDHAEMLTLLGQLRTATDPQARRDLADTVISEIVRHAVAEEMHVYPAVKKHVPGGAEAVAHDKEEHQEIEVTMKELEGADPGDPRFDTLVEQLETILRDHAADEETVQFPQLRLAVPREELLEIAAKVETAKRLAPTRPHPAAPHAKLFHQLAGPGVGLVDRLRDRLTGRATS